jgi:MerR family transcriptional regulator, light-induced transcriptional regulator
VSTPIRLIEYPDLPLYNIKAVAQTTGVSASTLRAWERRYQICRPQRAQSGYRLYSDRDIATLQWLKSHVEAGMSISQMVAWFEALVAGAPGLENVLLPQPNVASQEQHSTPVAGQLALRDYAALYQDLLAALVDYDEHKAEQVLSEAFSLYPLELVGEKVITPVLIEIGERWHRGEISVTSEHYASNYLLQRLAVLLRAGLGSAPSMSQEHLIWVGCAPGEQHEIGALLVTLYLRRAGYYTQYVGKDLPTEDLIAEVQRRRPRLILFSVSRLEVVPELQRLTALLANQASGHPIIGYGGRAFHEHPALRDQLMGSYMGDSAYDAVESTHKLMAEDRPANV